MHFMTQFGAHKNIFVAPPYNKVKHCWPRCGPRYAQSHSGTLNRRGVIRPEDPKKTLTALCQVLRLIVVNFYVQLIGYAH